MSLKNIVVLLCLFVCDVVHAAPEYIYWSNYGMVPLTLQGDKQVITRPFTLCKDVNSSLPLIAKLNLEGNDSGEWQINPDTFLSYGAGDCQSFELTLRPESVGKKQVLVHVSPCLQGVAECNRVLTVEADVIEEEEYINKIKQHLFYAGEQTVITDHELTTRLTSTQDGKQLWVGNSFQARLMNIHPDSYDLSRKASIPLSQDMVNSLLCPYTEDSFIEFSQKNNKVRRRDLSGNVISQSQDIPLHPCTTIETPTLRLVPGTCQPEAGVYSGRLEVRLDSNPESPWGTVCDDLFDDREAKVVCNQLGFRSPASGSAYSYSSSLCVPGTGLILLDDLECDGTESNLNDCPARNGSPRHNCDHDEDVAVSCSNPQQLEAVPVTGCPLVTDGLSRFAFLTCSDHQARLIDLSNLSSGTVQLENTLITAEQLAAVNFNISSWGALDEQFLMVSNQNELGTVRFDGTNQLTLRSKTPTNKFGQIQWHASAPNNTYVIGVKNGERVLGRIDTSGGDGVVGPSRQQVLDNITSLDRPLGMAYGSKALFISEAGSGAGMANLKALLEIGPDFSVPGLRQAPSTSVQTASTTPVVMTTTRIVASSSMGTPSATTEQDGKPDIEWYIWGVPAIAGSVILTGGCAIVVAVVALAVRRHSPGADDMGGVIPKARLSPSYISPKELDSL